MRNHWKWQVWLPIILIMLLPAIVYFPSLDNGFVIWDDDYLIYKNPLVTHFNLRTFWGAWTSYDPELYVPLTTLSYQLDHLFFGLQPSAFHLTNLALHIASALLLFFLLQHWGLRRNVALACALIFALHPMNAEGVAWASARKDTLSGFFLLATLLAWERFRASPTTGRYWSSVVLFLLALLSKVSVALLPIILLLVDWKSGRKIDRRAVMEKWPFLVLSSIFIVIALFGKTENISALSPVETLLLACKAIAFYITHYAVPMELSSIYQQTTAITVRSAEFFVPVIALLVAIAAIAMSLRRSRALAFSAMFFIVMLLPAFANFIKSGAVYFASDRYILIAQIGILYLLGIAWTRWHAVHVRTAVITTTVVLAMLLPTYAWAAYKRSMLWSDSETLFRDAVEKNPTSAKIHFNLGALEQERGNRDAARALYDKALSIDPQFSQAYNNKGLLLLDQGKPDHAEALFHMAVQTDPHNSAALTNLAKTFLDRGDPAGAIPLLLRAIDDEPHNVSALTKLGAAYGQKGMYEEGLRAFHRAWQLDPTMKDKAMELEHLLRTLQTQ